MKKSEIQIGGRYHAKVSGCLAVVRVTEMKEIPPPSWAREGRWRTVIYAVNEATGRKVTIRSPQRLRPLPARPERELGNYILRSLPRNRET